MTKPATYTRTRLTPDGRRQQLVDIGAELYATRSFGDVWVDEVAEAAQVSRGLIYHYFPTKREFYMAVLESNAASFNRRITEAAPGAVGLDRLTKSLRAYFECVNENRLGYRAVQVAALGGDPDVKALIEGGNEEAFELLCSEILGDEPPPPLLRAAITSWQMSLVGMSFEWIAGLEVDIDQLVALATRTLFAAVQTAVELTPGLEEKLKTDLRF
ncbi:MAG: TetR/AcrR family transcriptional regulator [Thermoleophilaceae bacterium]|nr:TetR/AcrR family transcriptional regulator [Thermoleophilaceae bacterium]